MTSLPTEMTCNRRNYTTSELPPTMSGERILDYAAVGRTAEDQVSLVLSDTAAQLLAKMILRYTTAGTFDDDHDPAFWDHVAIDLMTAEQLMPPRTSATTMIMSLGKTSDR